MRHGLWINAVGFLCPMKGKSSSSFVAITGTKNPAHWNPAHRKAPERLQYTIRTQAPTISLKHPLKTEKSWPERLQLVQAKATVYLPTKEKTVSTSTFTWERLIDVIFVTASVLYDVNRNSFTSNGRALILAGMATLLWLGLCACLALTHIYSDVIFRFVGDDSAGALRNTFKSSSSTHCTSDRNNTILWDVTAIYAQRWEGWVRATDKEQNVHGRAHTEQPPSQKLLVNT